MLFLINEFFGGEFLSFWKKNVGKKIMSQIIFLYKKNQNFLKKI
jgi:hypothetical protein